MKHKIIFILLMTTFFFSEEIFSQIPIYKIGEIPTQIKKSTSKIEFLLDANGPFIVEKQNGNSLSLTFDENQKKLSYQPSVMEDSRFLVEITGYQSGKLVSQIVEFIILPISPFSEKQKIGLQPSSNLLPPDDKTYLSITSYEYESEFRLNFDSTNTAREIHISGNHIIFEESHPNSLYAFHSDGITTNKNIGKVFIYGHVVEFKDVVHFPQTQVVIYADTLKFSKDAKLITTPITSGNIEPLPMAESGCCPCNEVDDFRSDDGNGKNGNNGKDGLTAGDVYLFLNSDIIYSKSTRPVQEVGTDGLPTSTTLTLVKPIIEQNGTNGQNGQSGGNGRCGKIICKEYTGLLNSLPIENATDCIKGIHENCCTNAGSACLCPLIDITIITPGNGGNGGDGGDGGAKGNTYVNNEIFQNSLLRSATDGQIGQKGKHGLKGTTSGGECINELTFPNSDGCCNLDGVDATLDTCSQYYQPANKSDGEKGKDGELLTPNSKIELDVQYFLHPNFIRKRLEYLQDAFLNRHFEIALNGLEQLENEIQLLKESDNWTTMSAALKNEFEEVQTQSTILLNRLNRNLDYFGNPAGWTPLMSLETNQSLYNANIDYSLGVMYLTYWVEDASSSLEEKRAQIDILRNNIATVLKGNISKSERLPNEIDNISSRIQYLNSALESIKSAFQLANERLEERVTEDLERQRKKQAALQLFTGVMSMIPYGSPAFQIAGSAISYIGETLITEQEINVLEGIENIASSAFDTNDARKTKEFIDLISGGIEVDGETYQLDDIFSISDSEKRKEVRQKYIDKIGEKSAPLIAKAKKIADEYKKTKEIPKDEYEAALNSLRETDIVYNDLANKIGLYTAEKEKLMEDLKNLMESLETINSDILNSLNLLNKLDEDFFEVGFAQSHQTVLAIQEMRKRAIFNLERYLYLIGKSYEYRLLEEYDINLNLTPISNEIITLLEVNNDQLLSENEYLAALRPVYQKQLTDVINSAFSNTTNSDISAIPTDINRTYSLSQEELETINSGDTVKINLSNYVSNDLENLRLVEILPERINVNQLQESSSDFKIKFQHSGNSQIQKRGICYSFTHGKTSDRRSLSLNWIFDYNSQEQRVTVDNLSPASESLFRNLLRIGGVPTSDENLMLFSQPGLDAEISIFSFAELPVGSKPNLSELVINFHYDYEEVPEDIAVLSFRPLSIQRSTSVEHIKFDKDDLLGRGDLLRDGNRIYDKGLSSVKLEVPKIIGSNKFLYWVKNEKEIISTNRKLIFDLDGNYKLYPIYKGDKFEEPLKLINNANYWSFGLSCGKIEYIGDLGGKIFDFNNKFFGVTSFLIGKRINYNTEFILRGTYGNIGYDDGIDDFASEYFGLNIFSKFNYPLFRSELREVLMPYVGIGIGITKFKSKSPNSLDDFSYNLPIGIGIEYKPIDRIRFFYQTSAFLNSSDKYDGIENSTNENTNNDHFWIHEIGVKYCFIKK